MTQIISHISSEVFRTHATKKKLNGDLGMYNLGEMCSDTEIANKSYKRRISWTNMFTD